ncbi:hypothetical protein FACS1894180_0140 [Bacteroidia bacterium]|nr:hypothetical protein FACS1894180_0140 [Bacteroidia bacterium]
MASKNYKQTDKIQLFDQELRSAKLSKLGNPLEKLHKIIDFELFRPLLEEKMLNLVKQSNAGRKPWDVVLMFKIILLKKYYNLSDPQAEYQIIDRQSFRDFIGLSSGDDVPDSRTIWVFQDNLIKQGLEKELFAMFTNKLDELGLIVNQGKIVDASFVHVPIQRNSKEENEDIKSGNGDNLWQDNPRKKSQKDIDARHTKKGGQKFYGYKDHIKADAKSKLIEHYEVMSAEVHDSQCFDGFITEGDKGQNIFADSAYRSEEKEEMLKSKEVFSQVLERAYRNKPLTDEQKLLNKTKSSTRCRVEHIFGFVKQNMGDFYLRCIGFKRAKGNIGLINLLYNMCRYEQIVRLDLLT